jgi:hypothetical protein
LLACFAPPWVRLGFPPARIFLRYGRNSEAPPFGDDALFVDDGETLDQDHAPRPSSKGFADGEIRRE